MNQTIKFSSSLLFLLAIVFAEHLFVLNQLELELFQDKIILSYVINYILATGIFFLMIKFREKLKNTLGFLFMGSSLFKFVVFFIIFYPSYKLDGETSKMEFAAFFVPYAICLTAEVFSLVKILNKS